MKLFTALVLLLLSTIALGADTLVGPPKGPYQLVDNNGNHWRTQVGYTTDGNGDVYTLGGLLAGDTFIGTGTNHVLIANGGKHWPLTVFYTTDGNGNVIPVSGGGGSGAAWGSITGTLSNQTDLQTALNAKASTSSLAAVATSGAYSSLSGLPTIPTNTNQLTNGSGYVNAAGAAAAAPVQSVFGRTGSVTATSGDYNTSLVTENTNLYFTNARAQAALSATLPLVDTAGVFSLNSFTGDSGSGGLAGGVPAPASGTAEQGYMLGAGGSFVANDTSKFSAAPFQMLSQTLAPSGDQKFQNVLMVQNGLSTYAVAGGGTTETVAIYNVTDQAHPVLRGSINLLGTYGVCGSSASWPYVFVPASGGRTLTVLNISNPNSPTVTATYSWAANTTSIYACSYFNGLVFMAGQSHGLGILDVGNGVSGGTLTAPVLAFDEGTTSTCSVANSCKSFGVAVDPVNSIAYSTDYSTASPWTYRQLKAYSFASSITAPTLLQNLTLSASNAKPLGVSLNLGTKTAFVQDANNAVMDVIDTTNVATAGMSQLSTLTPSGSRVFDSGVVAAQVSGSNFTYVASGSASAQGAIDLFDLTNRSSPVKVATVLASLGAASTSIFGGIAIDPRGGYLYVADYGNGTLGAGLDLFSMPFEGSTVGVESVSSLAVKNLLSIPVQASGVSPSSPVAGSLGLTSAFILCVYNGSAWVQAANGSTACTF